MSFGRSVLFLGRFLSVLNCLLPFCKVLVILCHNSLCFAVSFHKCLYIRITVIGQNIGEFIQFFIKLGFDLLYLFFQSFSFLTLENTRCFRKLLSQIRECDLLYADRIMKLCEAITEAYVTSGAGIPPETLLTKILQGTIGCAPAYDRYFKKALSITGAASQSCSARSLTALGKLYIDRKDEFEALRRHCSDRVEYPAAKVIDMCFFEYGFQNDGGAEE